MNVHQNARMTVHGRLLLVRRVREQGWRVEDAALAAGVSVRTAYKWLARHRAGGEGARGNRGALKRKEAPAARTGANARSGENRRTPGGSTGLTRRRTVICARRAERPL